MMENNPQGAEVPEEKSQDGGINLMGYVNQALSKIKSQAPEKKPVQ